MKIALPPARPFRQFAAHHNAWSDHYGALHVAARYAGIEMPEWYAIDGLWHHGVYPPWESNTPEYLTSSAPGAQHRIVCTARQDQADVLLANGFSKVQAIGLPMVYTAPSGLARRPRSLLIMPNHSLVGWKSPDRTLHERYADEMLKASRGFDEVVVCVSPSCQENGFWLKEFSARGFKIVIGAHPSDANALPRIRALCEQFETMTSNAWGSHVAYALALGMRVSIHGTFPALTRENLLLDTSWRAKSAEEIEKYLSGLTLDRARAHLGQFYLPPHQAVSDVAMGELLLGSVNRLEPQAMRALLSQLFTPIQPPESVTKEGEDRTEVAARRLGVNRVGKKILFVSHESTRTGAPMYFLHFLRWIHRNTQQDFDIFLRKDGALVEEFAKLGKVYRPADFAENPDLVKAYDLIYSNSASSGAMLEKWNYASIPIVTHLHELECAYECYGAAHMAAIIRQSNAFVACAQVVADRIQQRFRISSERISVHYEVVDTEFVLRSARDADLDALRVKYDIPADAFVVVGCGTFDLRKGADLFVQVAAHLRRRMREPKLVRFLWIGAMNSPDLRRFVEGDVRKLGLQSCITFINELPSPHGLLALSDIFCLTSREDPFPLVMLEAGVLGKPTVCFDGAGGGSEYCALGGGVAVPYLDAEAMARACHELMEQPRRRMDIGTRAAEIVFKRFSIEAGIPALWREVSGFLETPPPFSQYRTANCATEIYASWPIDEAPQRAFVASHLERQPERRQVQALLKRGRRQEGLRLALEIVTAAVKSREPLRLYDTLLEICEDIAQADPEKSRALAGQAEKIAKELGERAAAFRPKPANVLNVEAPVSESAATDDRSKPPTQDAVVATPAECELSELPVVLVRSHEFNYSETFIEDHVRHLSKNLTLLYGYPFPRFLKGGRSILSEAFEAKLKAVLEQSTGANIGEVWREYSAGLTEFFKGCGARVALAESGLMGSFVHEACERAALPYVVHFHGVDAVGQELLSQWLSHYQRFFKTAAALVVVSKAMQAQLEKLGAPTERIVLAPYGVAVELPAVANPAKAGPRFVAVGRFVEKKGPQLTLQAFAAVRREVPAARLTMVGDGPLLASCREWATANGLGDAVTFAGVQAREQVAQHLASSRVFVQHSLTAANGDSEGLPLAVLEAGAHGLPVVSTRHAGIPDAVREGSDGFLVDEKDVASMAAAMLRLAREPELAAQLGESFRTRVRAEFSRRVSIGRLQALLAAAAGPEAPVAAESNDAFAAVANDRNDPAAHAALGHRFIEAGELAAAYCAFGEVHRLTGGTEETQQLLPALEANGALEDATVKSYRQRAGWTPTEKSTQPRRILIVTNLLPPQEMGGYGRTMWEFSRELIARGHAVRVLTADMPTLLRKPTPEHAALEPHVRRTLRLVAEWKDGGIVHESDANRRRDIVTRNHRTILAEAKDFAPDVVIAGNLDFVGHQFVQEILGRGVPVLHRLGNAMPGYDVAHAPRSPLYCIAGCSEWVNEGIRAAGYPVERFAVLPPGSPLREYYRAFPASREKLRIAFASLLMPYKGAHVLVEALAYLQRAGIDFECTLAGDSTSPDYVEKLKAVAQKNGFAEKLRLPGFLAKKELAGLYARTNVLVFPSVFEEPFGKTQVEAMAAGLLVISSGTGGSREIIRDGVTGLQFASSNACELAEKLAWVHANQDAAGTIAAAGQEEAFRYTTEASVDRLEAILQELIVDAKRGKRAPALAAT